MNEAAPGNLPLRVHNCSIERALGVVGEKWTFLVLREAFGGVRRFADMQAATGAPRQVLSARLTRLVEEGLLRKVPYREPGQRQRDEYRLTQMGLDLYPTLVALMQWGDRYLSDHEGPPVRITHRGCGAPVEQHFRCADGHEVAGPREVTPVPGPGMRLRVTAPGAPGPLSSDPASPDPGSPPLASPASAGSA
ncbi:helix-turn-helix domain-containing protein [Streptosporangium sp. NPDC048865]|uniref:winged helix-turn-helix transcriptional regulator n=1 Tax=Streptosporangium sp. NPDC048865 TaxID=3155766 RepID=UPI00343975CA